jgi:Big-like domain-containing protein
MNPVHTSRVVSRGAAALFLTIGLAMLSARSVSAQLPGGSLVVTITSPTSGSTVGGTIPVNASATGLGGLIVQAVQFKVDGANIGAEDGSTPYSVQWNTKTVSNGSHTLTAIARDTVGGQWSSDPVTVTVFNDLIAPTVAMTAPTAGAVIRGAAGLSATATDNVGVVGVQFRLDGANVGAEDTSSPYGVSWNTATATDGAHTLSAVARDAAGNTATSAGVPVVVDNTAPTVTISDPAAGAMVTGTTTLSASASDGVGVAGVSFLLDGAPLGAEDATAPYTMTWDTTPVASGSHVVTAVARDAAGNARTSAAVTVVVSQTATRFENTDLAITYTDGVLGNAPGQTPAWFHGSRSRDWSGRLSSFNRSEGARATFHFQGTTVRWIGFRAPWAGIARVYIDDVFVTELDLYATTDQPQSVVFSRTGLTNGPHTLTAESTGRKNPASVDYAVVVDAFDVAPAAPHPAIGARTEQSGLSLSAGWTPAEATTRAWSGGTAIVSATAGAQATFTFVGTEVRWVGLRGPQMGIAQVNLDGALHARVDAYDANESEEVTFVITGLAAGTHTLTIGVTGDKNPAATGTNVVVDALDVRSRIEDQDPSIAYTNGWLRAGMAKDWSGSAPNTAGGTAALTRTAGEQATVRFTGTGVSWIGLRGPSYGIARVLVDGVLAATVDTYAATEEVQTVVYTAAGLSDGAHTLTVEVTGDRNAASIDSLVIVDAFEVTLSSSAPAVARFQETDTAATYSGTWTQLPGFRYWTGENAAFSTTAGASVTFSFTGPAVRWIGYRTFYGGIARVLLDGVEVAQVDTFAPIEEEFQAVMYAATGLPGTSHTLTIENTGLKAAAAQNTWVTVDAFDVY